MSRPHISVLDLTASPNLKAYIAEKKFEAEIIEQAEIEIKYGGYLSKEKESVKKLKRLEKILKDITDMKIIEKNCNNMRDLKGFEKI